MTKFKTLLSLNQNLLFVYGALERFKNTQILYYTIHNNNNNNNKTMIR